MECFKVSLVPMVNTLAQLFEVAFVAKEFSGRILYDFDYNIVMKVQEYTGANRGGSFVCPGV